MISNKSRRNWPDWCSRLPKDLRPRHRESRRWKRSANAWKPRLRRTAGYFAESKRPTLEQARAVLPDDAALVEFIRFRPFDPKALDAREAFGEPRYAAYVVRSAGPVRWTDLGAASDIDSRVDCPAPGLARAAAQRCAAIGPPTR